MKLSTESVLLATILVNLSLCEPSVAFLRLASRANTTFGSDPTCPSSGIKYFPNYSDCHLFFECDDGKLIPLQCPPGAAWDIVKNKCQLESQVDCSYVTPSGDSDCPSNGIAYLPNYADCTKYFQCQMGVKIPQQCKDGEAWSTTLDACDLKEYVDCSYTTLFPPSTSTSKPSNECPYPSSTITFLPDYADCSIFYECINRQKFQLKCPTDYLWDRVAIQCRYKDFVNCDYTTIYPTQSTTTSTTTTTTKSITTTTTTPKPTSKSTPSTPPSNICWTHENGDTFPYPYDCMKYYECSNNVLIIRNCAEGTSYDADMGSCDTNFEKNCT